MNETKPLLLLEKYRSILISAIIVETVTFAVSLTDSLVAANRIGTDALSSVGLFAPFFSVSTFFTAIINAGTMMLFSTAIGKYNKQRAAEHFSQGCIMAVVSGVLLTIAVFLVKPLFISSLKITPEIRSYLISYYNVATLYFLFDPISCILDNAVVSDGGEKFSAAANILQIVGNIVLSLMLSERFGIVGIAAATVGCKAAFVVVICLWFFTKNNTLRFVRYFSWEDMRIMLGKGSVRASTFATTACMMWLMNRFVLEQYDITTFQIWVIAQKILGLSAIFEGFTLTLRPIISTLKCENNTKAMRFITRCLRRELIGFGALFTVMIFCFTSQFLRLFGIRSGDVFEAGVYAIRIVSITIVFGAQIVMLFIYYFMIDKPRLSVTVEVLKDLICPVGLTIFLESLHDGDPRTLWIALAVSNLLCLIVTTVIILVRYNKDMFPLLLPKEQDEHIHIYAFKLTPENISLMSETAGTQLRNEGFSQRVQNLAGMCIEDMLNLAMERSPGHASITAECTLITEDTGARVVLRDNGSHFDVNEEKAENYSFTKYTVDRVLSVSEYHAYVTAAGYNSNELLFAEVPQIKSSRSGTDA